MISPKDGDLCLLFSEGPDVLSGRRTWIGEVEVRESSRARRRERNMEGNKDVEVLGLP